MKKSVNAIRHNIPDRLIWNHFTYGINSDVGCFDPLHLQLSFEVFGVVGLHKFRGYQQKPQPDPSKTPRDRLHAQLPGLHLKPSTYERKVRKRLTFEDCAIPIAVVTNMLGYVADSLGDGTT